MGHEELLKSLPIYAAGGLDRTGRQDVDTHLLSGCATCRTELKEFQAVAAALPYTLAPLAAPRTLRSKVLAGTAPLTPAPEVIKRSNQPSLEPGEWMKHLFPPTPRFPTLAVPAVAVLGLIFIGTFLYMGYAAYVRTVVDAPVTATLREESKQAQQQLAQLQAHVREQETAIAQAASAVETRDSVANELRERLILREAELDDARTQLAQLDKDSATQRRLKAQADDVAALFRSQTARPMVIVGADRARDAGGLVLYDPANAKAFLYAFNVPPPPAGSLYQVWAIESSPRLVGQLKIDASLKARLPIKGLPTGVHISKFAVTLEADSAPGPAPTPSGPLVLSATL